LKVAEPAINESESEEDIWASILTGPILVKVSLKFKFSLSSMKEPQLLGGYPDHRFLRGDENPTRD
jgi:hypothetical protein